MQFNVGSTDRIVRIVLGIILLSLLFILDGGVKYIGLVGIILILTSLFKFCPLYLLFRINTNSNKK